MNQRMPRLPLIALVLPLLGSCSKDVTGPTPLLATGGVTRVDPAVQRGEVDAIGLCRDNVIQFVGEAFSPLVLGVATDNPSVEMPTVVLEHSDGVAEHVYPILPSDTAWLDANTMQIKIPYCAPGQADGACDQLTLPWTQDNPGETADDAWPFGRWNLRVTNPNGEEALLEQALLVVKPPRLDGIDTGETPDDTIACSNPDMTVGLLGRSFRPEVLVNVTDQAGTLWFTGVDGETDSGVALTSQNRLDITIPQATHMVLGPYDIEVVNPEECSAKKAQLLKILAPPFQGIEPNSQACSQKEMKLTFVGDQWRDGAQLSLINDDTGDSCGSTLCSAASYTVTYVDDGHYSVDIVTPELPAGTYSGRVYYWEGCETKNAGALEIVQPPLTAVVPQSQPCSAGSLLFEIDGSSLRPGATLRLTDAAGSVVLEAADGTADSFGNLLSFVDETHYRLSLLAGALPAGKYDVELYFFDGCTTTLPEALEILPPPFEDVLPEQQACSVGDLEFELTGHLLGPNATVRILDSTGATVLELHDAEAAAGSLFQQVNELSYQLSIAYGTLPSGSYDVEVWYYEGCSKVLEESMLIAPPPLQSVAPDQICVDLATELTLSGTDLGPGATIFINDTPVDAGLVTWVDSTSTTVQLGANSLSPGLYDVGMSYYGGCAAELTGSLLALAAPLITSVEPPEVCSGSETHITIHGEGFGTDARVTVGPVTDLVPDSVASDGTSLTVTVPGEDLQLAAKLDVTVVNVAGCSATLVKAVTVVTGPTVVAVDPATIYNEVNFPVSLFGSGFGTASTVTVASIDGTIVESVEVLAIVDGARIDAVIPSGLPAGLYNLIVTDEKGCNFNFAGSLTVTDQLTVRICEVVPPFGWTGAKSPVTILSGSDAECSPGDASFLATPRAWLNIAGLLTPIRNVGFVTEETLTGSVPAGYEIGGPYDVLVLNPDGGIGLLPEAFSVTSLPVPSIDAINPASVDTSFDGTLTLYGDSFRSPVQVDLWTASGSVIPLPAATVLDSNTLEVPLNTAGLLVGVYVVRVTNLDEGTYNDFSALAVTNPSSNLLGFPQGETLPSLNTPRIKLGLVSGQTSSAARYLYAVGGSDSAGNALATVEFVPLDLFGGLGQWVEQRYQLETPRVGPGVVRQGAFLWVLGGLDASGTPVNSVERAQILDPDEAPEFTNFTFTLTGSLQAGAWYYRVSATMPIDHPTNPGGETLPGEMAVVNALEGASVWLQWDPVAELDATYNIYRSATPDAVAGQEVLIASGIPANQTVFVDNGTLVPAEQHPLRPGSTGRFVTMPVTLNQARGGAGTVIAPDPDGLLYLYVAGGQGASAALDSYEYALLSGDGATLAPFTTGSQTLGTGRAWPVLVEADSSTSDMLPDGENYLFICGGRNTAEVKTIYQARISSGGATGPWTTTNPSTTKGLPGAMGYMRHNALFLFGGESGGTPSAFSFSANFITPPAFSNFNSLGGSGLPAPLAYAGLVIETAYLYLVGGTPDGTTVTGNVLRQVY